MFGLTRQILAVLLVTLIGASALGVGPEFQAIPLDVNNILASGVADVTGPNGVSYVEYWIWDGGNGYYYYTYRIYNDSFEPYVKHLTIGNPTTEPYYVTGPDPETSGWSSVAYSSSKVLVNWFAEDPNAVIYPDQNSPPDALFQFASALPPATTTVTVREGTPVSRSHGLIPGAGYQTSVTPRSAGYWKHQFSGKGKRKEASSLPVYMDGIEMYSDVFADDLAGDIFSDLAVGVAILDPEDSSDMRAKAERQLFAVWLNVISGKLDFYLTVTFDPDAVNTEATNVEGAVEQIENTLLNPGATLEELENVKDIAEILNCM